MDGREVSELLRSYLITHDQAGTDQSATGRILNRTAVSLNMNVGIRRS